MSLTTLIASVHGVHSEGTHLLTECDFWQESTRVPVQAKLASHFLDAELQVLCLTNSLLGDNTRNHSGGGFLLFVLLHPLSCSISILTCSLLTALIRKTEIINEFRLCLEETRNSQEWLCSVELAQLSSAPTRLCGLPRAGVLWPASLLLPQSLPCHLGQKR